MEQLPSRFSILGQALIKQKCNLLKLLITHPDCLLRDSAAPPAVWGLLRNICGQTEKKQGIKIAQRRPNMAPLRFVE